ncbi:pyridoxal phosphate-dependent aminotransferase [Acrocarpospora macrocephala]|nr:pyridoxal phosphate-dependent aminotransferase [Acrocarpospora macrocephala]
MPDSAVTRMMAAAPLADEIDLSVGQPDQQVAPAIRQAGIAAIAEGRTGYTPKLGLAELRTLMAEDIATATGHRPSPEDVVITIGGTGAVAVAIAAVCSPGRPLLVPDPAWPNYRVLAASLGIPVLTYRQGPGGAAFLDLDEIDRGLTAGARLVVVNSPANPTGAVASADLLATLVDLVRSHGATILSDEAYESIVFDGTRAPSPLTTGPDLTFACRTFSKSHAMTGWRVGALTSPPSYRAHVAALHGTTAGCAPAIAQYAAIAALDGRGPTPTHHSACYAERYALAQRVLGDLIPAHSPGRLGGFYAWADASATGLTGLQLTDRLRQHKILVSAGEVYSATAPGCFRISLTQPADILTSALHTIRQAIP